MTYAPSAIPSAVRRTEDPALADETGKRTPEPEMPNRSAVASQLAGFIAEGRMHVVSVSELRTQGNERKFLPSSGFGFWVTYGVTFHELKWLIRPSRNCDFCLLESVIARKLFRVPHKDGHKFLRERFELAFFRVVVFVHDECLFNIGILERWPASRWHRGCRSY